VGHDSSALRSGEVRRGRRLRAKKGSSCHLSHRQEGRGRGNGLSPGRGGGTWVSGSTIGKQRRRFSWRKMLFRHRTSWTRNPIRAIGRGLRVGGRPLRGVEPRPPPPEGKTGPGNYVLFYGNPWRSFGGAGREDQNGQGGSMDQPFSRLRRVPNKRIVGRLGGTSRGCQPCKTGEPQERRGDRQHRLEAPEGVAFSAVGDQIFGHGINTNFGNPPGRILHSHSC